MEGGDTSFVDGVSGVGNLQNGLGMVLVRCLCGWSIVMLYFSGVCAGSTICLSRVLGHEMFSNTTKKKHTQTIQ